MFGLRKKRKYKRHHDRFEDGYAFELSPEIKKSILIISLFAMGGVSLFSLFGTAGLVGNYINVGLGLMLGWAKIIFPAVVIAGGFLLYYDDQKWVHGHTYVGLFLFLLSILSLLHIFLEDPDNAAAVGRGGGYIGLFLIKIAVSLVGFWASILILVCLLAVSLMLIFNTTLSGLIGEDGALSVLTAPFRFVWDKIVGRADDEDDDNDEEENESRDNEDAEYEEEENEDFNSRELVADDQNIEEENDDESDEDEKSMPIKKSNIKINIPIDLLSSKIGKPSGADVKNCSEIIQRTMENFGIPVEMGEHSVGPTVTQYTFKPADGVKLSRITGLSNDLALALAMHPIRIEAPIPGKALVGIEVPNRIIARVGLREILDTPQFRKREVNTMLALGKDVAGTAWLANLAKMPHLLVAGATGSGKSVCLNTIIVSLLYQNNPDDLKFIMVDPKRVELPVYNGIPYLLTPVITDVPRTINSLKWCLNEMDRRFDVLAQAGKRNIDSYNLKAKEKLPYIVFVIDELADLMVVAARDVEGTIIRIAQMARAVGIHLILATQRPSVDVLTGLIKANIPARIAFSVSSSIDSRTILDTQGAEKLLGRGDMLFITSDMSKPRRIQGAYVDDKEIKKITNYIKEQAGAAEYIEDIVGKQKVVGVAGAGFNSDDSDDLLEEAKEIIINSGKASTSFLQRRLRIGYARAARLIDLLEDSGVIGPANGAKAREILITQEEYAKVSEQTTAGMPVHSRENTHFNMNNVMPADDEDEENDDEEEEDDDEDDDDVEMETADSSVTTFVSEQLVSSVTKKDPLIDLPPVAEIDSLDEDGKDNDKNNERQTRIIVNNDDDQVIADDDINKFYSK